MLLQAHRLLGCTASIAARHDVLPIGGEPYGESPKRAQAACTKLGVPFNPHIGAPEEGAHAASGGPQKAPQGFYVLQPGEAIYI